MEVVTRKRLEGEGAAAGKQGGDDFEGGVFGGGADERDGARLDGF